MDGTSLVVIAAVFVVYALLSRRLDGTSITAAMVFVGAGFLFGGLCPGTSCVAAATGRLDGLGVIAGMLAGVAAFNGAFPLVADFYASTPMGAVTITELAGVSRGTGVAIVTLAAIAGFALATRIERGRV